ncbi:MAG: hypothetical protein ACO1OF_16350 [Adhaeribacter sp.]
MQEEIKAAAKLWADKLKEDFSQDAGDENLNGLLRLLKKTRPKVTPEQVENFEFLLIEHLLVKHEMYPTAHISFGVDYNPDSVLYCAVKGSGIDPNHLPIKSYTTIEPGKVSYTFGYGQPWETIEIEKAK